MFPTFNGKPPLDCSEDDLQVIVNNPDHSENEHIDYKSEYKIGKIPKDKADILNEEKDKLRNDICAFANADGGYIIYGIKEGENHIPCSIDGIDIPNGDLDGFERGIRDLLQVIKPRIPNISLKFIKLKNEKYVVVILVKHDYFAPYLYVVNDNNYRAYKRYGNGNRTMSYSELKNMFTQSITLEKEVEAFRTERTDFFRAELRERGESSGRFFLFHIIPDTFLDSNYDKPMFIIEQRKGHLAEMFSPYSCRTYSVPIVEGLRYYDNHTSNECRIFNNGIIEVYSLIDEYLSVIRDLGNGRPDANCIILAWKNLINHLEITIRSYFRNMMSIIDTSRLFVCLSIIGCRGIKTQGLDYYNRKCIIDRNVLLCDPVAFNDIANESLRKTDTLRFRLATLLSIGVHDDDILDDTIYQLYGDV